MKNHKAKIKISSYTNHIKAKAKPKISNLKARNLNKTTFSKNKKVTIMKTVVKWNHQLAQFK